MSEESAFPGAHFCSSPSAPASRPGSGSHEVGLPNPSQRNSQIASLIIFKGSLGAGALTFISPPTLLSFLQALLTPFAQGAPRDPRRDSRGERSPWLPLEAPSVPPTGSLCSHCCAKPRVATSLHGLLWFHQRSVHNALDSQPQVT